MLGGRVIMLSREGWYYLFVLVFILVGAVLREINLLVLMAGLMMGPLLYSWRYVAVSTRELTGSRQTPPRIAAGEFLPVFVTAGNTRRRMDNWMLNVVDTIQREGSPRRERGAAEVVFPHIPAGESRTASYRVLLSRRGKYRIGPMRCSTKFPLGLVYSSATLRVHHQFVVCPRLGILSPVWQQLIRGDRSGAHASRSRAGSADGDFYALREWRAGDSRRLIHWRTSARIGGLAVRQLEQRTTPSLVILIDLYRSPEQAGEPKAETRVELALSFAATAINDLTGQGRSRIVVALASQTAEVWAAAGSSLLAQELLDAFAVAQPGDGATLIDAMERSIEQRPLGAKIVVISTRPQSAAGPAANPLELELPLEWIDVGDPVQLDTMFRLEPVASPAVAKEV